LPEWLEAYTKQDKRISCLFGEHLLSKYPNNPVALVEAPKTAVYSTLYCGLPETPDSLLWLAVYNKSSLTFDKLKVLQGRFVYVFPDLSKDGNTFKEWETKAKEFAKRMPGTRFIFSDLLEQLAPEQDKIEGNDLADYLIKQDWRLFRKRNIQEQTPQPEPEKVTGVTKVTPQQNILFLRYVEQKQNWSSEIKELETYFNENELPTGKIKLNDYATIIDAKKFVSSHLNSIKTHNGNETFSGSLKRLQELKELLILNSN